MVLSGQKNTLLGKDTAKIGFSKAMALGWIHIDKTSGTNKVARKVSSVEDLVQEHLNLIGNHKEKDVLDKAKQDYKKRKLLQEEYDVSSGYVCNPK